MESKGFEDIDQPSEAPKPEVYTAAATKSSGASFSSHSMDVTPTMPTSKVAFNTVSNCAQVNVIKSVIRQDSVKVADKRFNRNPSVGKLQLRKQVSSAAFATIEPLKEFKTRPDGPIQVFKQASKESDQLKVFSVSRRSTSVTKGLFRQRSTSQISSTSECAFNIQKVTAV